MSDEKKLPITIMIDTERSYKSLAHVIRTPLNPDARIIRVLANAKAKSLETAGELLSKRRLTSWPEGPALTSEDYADIKLVTIDTISHAADIARRELTGTPRLGQIWDQRNSLVTDQRDWGIMTDYLARSIEGTVSFCEQEGIMLLLLAHQRRVEDEAGKDLPKTITMDFNQKLLNEVAQNSDYVWRIWREEKELTVGGVKYPRNTHFLRMTTSDNKATKIRIPYIFVDKLTDNLPNPTLPKVLDILRGFGEEFLPLVFTVYGPWGSGKTTFGGSLSDPGALTEGIPQVKTTLRLAT